MTMVSFQEYLKANNWRGTHVRKQMKRYAHAIRQSGGSYNKTYSQLAQSWTPDQWRYWIRDRRIKRVIQLYGHDDQRTDAWHAARSQMVTASEVCSVIDGTPSQRHEVMLRKLMPRSDGGRSQNLRNPLVWGTVFEPIAKRIYEQETKCKIKDVSCVRHKTVEFLGASPDGIILSDDRERHNSLIELKCPISREIGGDIPKSYYHQMQLQMECAGVDECEYAEFQFKLVYYSEWMDFKGVRGIFAQYDDGGIVEWTSSSAMIDNGSLAYWVMKGVHRDLVVREEGWLTKHLPAIDVFWKEVLRHRAANTLPEKQGIMRLEL